MMNLKPIQCLVSFLVTIFIDTGQASWANQPQWPVKGIVSSTIGWRADPFGHGSRFHAGMDIAAPYGTPIIASERGIVAFSGWYGGYGNLVAVAHGNGLYTLYGHTSVRHVKPNQIVEKGQIIATVGSTGRSTGPHLHFEVHHSGRYINPNVYLGQTSIVIPALKRAKQHTTGSLKMASILKNDLNYRQAGTTVFSEE